MTQNSSVRREVFFVGLGAITTVVPITVGLCWT
jgi:hypothetical protein